MSIMEHRLSFFRSFVISFSEKEIKQKYLKACESFHTQEV